MVHSMHIQVDLKAQTCENGYQVESGSGAPSVPTDPSLFRPRHSTALRTSDLGDLRHLAPRACCCCGQHPGIPERDRAWHSLGYPAVIGLCTPCLPGHSRAWHFRDYLEVIGLGIFLNYLEELGPALHPGHLHPLGCLLAGHRQPAELPLQAAAAAALRPGG